MEKITDILGLSLHILGWLTLPWLMLIIYILDGDIDITE